MTLFVNLHVKDLPASLRFFENLGLAIDRELTGDEAGCVTLAEGASLLLVTEPFFKSVTGKDIPDTTAGNEVALALQVDARAKVDDIVSAALANGGTKAGEVQDDAVMYSRSFRDLDGHLWSVLHMG
ncbi:VOC family protein [Nonomuraea jiangxiensis]|uniref:VOC domain-containing protein n=1 Tax=Nonomuraea jiangxiensis TaxID=633440 RepID=A0A1G9WDT0_9ACTN|nr:VOC family protein [Nonomuraea jiangxiensis]SDM82630.1 polar amino acid transport system ATP-binding protein/hypothetical protein [Nonomuraea jiangxiensis]